MGYKLMHGKTDALCSLQEIKGCCIIAKGINPRANGCDFLSANIKVGINCSIATIDEESKLSKSAA